MDLERPGVEVLRPDAERVSWTPAGSYGRGETFACAALPGLRVAVTAVLQARGPEGWGGWLPVTAGIGEATGEAEVRRRTSPLAPAKSRRAARTMPGPVRMPRRREAAGAPRVGAMANGWLRRWCHAESDAQPVGSWEVLDAQKAVLAQRSRLRLRRR